MDTEHAQWDQYQARFEEVAELAEDVDGPAPEIASAKLFICLYGENGMSPEDEFTMLDNLEKYIGEGLKRVDVRTAYWEDTVLFVPK